MSTVTIAYFLTRRNGRFGSSTAGGVSPNAGGALSKSAASGAVSTCTVIFTGAAGGGVGAVGCAQDCSVLYPCVGGGALTHCGCCGTLTSGAVPNPVIFPLHPPRSVLLFLYHVCKLRYLKYHPWPNDIIHRLVRSTGSMM